MSHFNSYIPTGLLHGQFEFYLQKYQTNKKEVNYFQLSEQLQERFVSQRLEELCGYYANRLSYENLAGLVERVTGKNFPIKKLPPQGAGNYNQIMIDHLTPRSQGSPSGLGRRKKKLLLHPIYRQDAR